MVYMQQGRSEVDALKSAPRILQLCPYGRSDHGVCSKYVETSSHDLVASSALAAGVLLDSSGEFADVDGGETTSSFAALKALCQS
jgi:hypothetical protein